MLAFVFGMCMLNLSNVYISSRIFAIYVFHIVVKSLFIASLNMDETGNIMRMERERGPCGRNGKKFCGFDWKSSEPSNN